MNKKNTKTKSFKVLFFVFSIFLLPSLTFAFAVNLSSFVATLFNSFNLILPILNGIAFLVFFYGIGKFILSAGNEKEVVAGKQFMIWGVLALFVLVSFWGIMQFLSTQFDFPNPSGFPVLPTNSVVGTSSSNVTYPSQ